jgi:hypothetical protein
VNWNHGIRQIHRWLSIIFTLCVIANFVVLGRETLALYVGLFTLLPLSLLLFTGLYLFVLPYTVRWRSGRRSLSA